MRLLPTKVQKICVINLKIAFPHEQMQDSSKHYLLLFLPNSLW
jgi:hypothetical protein